MRSISTPEALDRGGLTAPRLQHGDGEATWVLLLDSLGATEIIEVLINAGVGIEAGVWTVEDAEQLAASGFGGQVTRILVEPVEVGATGAVELVGEIHEALDRGGLTAPR